ncbi:MAG: MATE family multidrug resistance protein [Crocinitomicaceae bacterium]|jgi:MATE family multidrug resistance protein
MLDLSHRSLLKVAIPLMASTFIQSIVLLTDSSFLSRYDTLAFDAAGNGGLIFITMYMAMVGMNEGAQILLARRIGEGRENLIPRIFGTSIIINVLLAIVLLVITFFVLPDLLLEGTKHKEIGALQFDYVQIRSFGMIPSIFTLAIIAYFTSIGRTSIVLISAVIIAFMNIGLDYSLIFGNAGFPEMGLKGAALASTLSDTGGALFLIGVLIFDKKSKNQLQLKYIRFKASSFNQLIKLGSPIMFQGIVALLTWTIFFFWIEQIGIFELTVSQNIRTLYFLAFVPIWGFGATTKTYISQYIGKGDFEALPIIIRRIQFLTVIFLLVFFHGAILYPEQLISLINPNPEFIETSAQTLRFLFGSMLIYGVVSIYFNTIAGSGNTRFTLLIELVSVLLYIVFAYLFIKVYKFEICWIWSVEYIYFGTIGILSILYLKFFNWQKKQL